MLNSNLKLLIGRVKHKLMTRKHFKRLLLAKKLPLKRREALRETIQSSFNINQDRK